MKQTSIVTVKGQIVIPAKLRKKVGIKKGMKVFMEEKNGDIIVHPATPDFYERMFGVLKGGHLTKALEESRQKDKEKERRSV